MTTERVAACAVTALACLFAAPVFAAPASPQLVPLPGEPPFGHSGGTPPSGLVQDHWVTFELTVRQMHPSKPASALPP
jgi:hypothetical protein